MTMPASSGYRAIAALIQADIVSGKYPRGTELPLQDNLAAHYGVAQSTITKALAVLTAAGLVQTRRGKRAIVTAIPPILRNPSLRYSKAARERAGAVGAYDAEVRALGLEPRVDLTVSRATPPTRVAELLDVPADQESTVVRARIMWADNTKTQLADSYIPLDIAGGTVLEQIDEGSGGMISRMREMGYAQVRVTERTTGRPATTEEARALDITENQHVYEIEHVGYTATGRAVEVCIHVMPQHLWILDTEFELD
jgi:GntR family transcriptional regulator